MESSQVADLQEPPRHSWGGFFLRAPWVWISILVLLTVLAYLPGLQGPFLFDDVPNIIQPATAWLQGETGWQEVVLGNDSGLLHRPLSNLSFALNVLAGGFNPAQFKAVNLLIHIMCGLCIYILLRRLLKRDPALGEHSGLVAFGVAAVWLLHPMHVSTVLYVVQRMAQLSALFSLLALIAFVVARDAFDTGRKPIGIVGLFLAVPFFTMLAVLSKENGALVPLLCAVIELTYYRRMHGEKSGDAPAVRAFFLVVLIVPFGLAAIWYLINLSTLVSSYEGRLFSLSERLLTQPRVLFDYVHALLLPRGPMLGVYTDDFVVSRGLFMPATTALSVFGLLLAVAAAIGLRSRIPAFSCGLGIFLAGHIMESSIFPLELYFEHRNYLPSFGLFLAIAGLLGWICRKVLLQSQNPRRLTRTFSVAGAAFLALLAFATHARSGVWSSWYAIAQEGVRNHPESLRAHLDMANLLQIQGENEEVQRIFDKMKLMRNPAARHAGIIDTVTLGCMVEGRTDRASVSQMREIAGAKLQLPEMLAFENLGNVLHRTQCDGITKDELADIIVHVIDHAPQPQQLVQIWRSRFVAARLYQAAGDAERASMQAALAWIPGTADPAVGIFLTGLYMGGGDIKSARVIRNNVAGRVKTWDRRSQAALERLDELLESQSQQ